MSGRSAKTCIVNMSICFYLSELKSSSIGFPPHVIALACQLIRHVPPWPRPPSKWSCRIPCRKGSGLSATRPPWTTPPSRLWSTSASALCCLPVETRGCWVSCETLFVSHRFSLRGDPSIVKLPGCDSRYMNGIPTRKSV